MSYKISFGTYHPALEEPYKIEVICEGESVRDAVVHVRFNSRGIEWLAERRNFIQDIVLLERVCGICSHLHTHIFCMAVEQLAGLTVPWKAAASLNKRLRICRLDPYGDRPSQRRSR
ncbi:MAG: nickel-dependent hydrogenase large subunit [Nitrospiraceae bacterium]|nr:nickel-dependent hydrogenase large subunit [Nitrospiraceae bacterium]